MSIGEKRGNVWTLTLGQRMKVDEAVAMLEVQSEACRHRLKQIASVKPGQKHDARFVRYVLVDRSVWEARRKMRSPCQ